MQGGSHAACSALHHAPARAWCGGVLGSCGGPWLSVRGASPAQAATASAVAGTGVWLAAVAAVSGCLTGDVGHLGWKSFWADGVEPWRPRRLERTQVGGSRRLWLPHDLIGVMERLLSTDRGRGGEWVALSFALGGAGGMTHEGHVRVGIRMAIGRPGRSVRRAIRLRCAVPRDFYIVDARDLQDGAAPDTPPCGSGSYPTPRFLPPTSSAPRCVVVGCSWFRCWFAQLTPPPSVVRSCVFLPAVAVALRSVPRPYSERPVVPARLPRASPSSSSLHRLHPHTPPRPSFLLTGLMHSPCILAVFWY